MVSTKKTISVTSDRELRETYTCILATMERMLFGRTSNSERSRYRYRAVCCRSVPAPHHNTNSGRWGAVDRRNCRLRRAVAVGKCPRRAVSCVCCVPAAPTTNRVDLMDLWIRVNEWCVLERDYSPSPIIVDCLKHCVAGYLSYQLTKRTNCAKCQASFTVSNNTSTDD